MAQKINELDIRITKAVITRVTWQMSGEKHQWAISGNLLTPQGAKVSEFTFYTEAWSDEQKIVLPPNVDIHMRAIIESAIIPVLDKLNGLTQQLPEGKQK